MTRASCSRSYQIVTVVRRLHDLEAVVVLARKPRLRQAARDAPIGQRQVLGTVVGALPEASPHEAQLRALLARRASPPRACTAEFSRSADRSPTRSGTRSSGRLRTSGRRPARCRPPWRDPLCRPDISSSTSRRAADTPPRSAPLSPQLDRPLERNADLLVGGPHALQIRMPPRCLGNGRRYSRPRIWRRWRSEHWSARTKRTDQCADADHGAGHRKNSMSHFMLPGVSDSSRRHRCVPSTRR